MDAMDANVMAPAPKFDSWLAEKRFTNVRAAEALEVNRETVRLYRLPFTDDRRLIPSAKVMERIHALTKGEVTPADFYPPHLAHRTEGQG